jgi:para-nitrobenzyl esterase
MSRTSRFTAVALAFGATASVLGAQQPPAATEVGATLVASVTVPANGGAKLTVSSPAFKMGGDIPMENTQYKGNVFPGLSWSAGPAGTKSYAIIMQDGDGVRNNAPFLHWTMMNIPTSVTKLEPAMTTPPAGTIYGPNYKGAHQPYLGPHTPAGPKHRYHLQVFALDMELPAGAADSYEALTGAMKGHVLASGEVIGLGSAPAP